MIRHELEHRVAHPNLVAVAELRHRHSLPIDECSIHRFEITHEIETKGPLDARMATAHAVVLYCQCALLTSPNFNGFMPELDRASDLWTRQHQETRPLRRLRPL